jgi:hypothetical protein
VPSLILDWAISVWSTVVVHTTFPSAQVSIFASAIQLARLEGKCALEALYTHWPRLELAVQLAQILAQPTRYQGQRHPAGGPDTVRIKA